MDTGLLHFLITLSFTIILIFGIYKFYKWHSKLNNPIKKEKALVLVFGIFFLLLLISFSISFFVFGIKISLPSLRYPLTNFGDLEGYFAIAMLLIAVLILFHRYFKLRKQLNNNLS